jgi:hypothetical protein
MLRPKRSNSQTAKKSHIRSRSWASDNLRYLSLPWPLARGPLGLPHLATFAATYGPKPPSHTQPCSRWAQDADPFKIANQARTVTSAAAVRASYRHNCAFRLASRQAVAEGESKLAMAKKKRHSRVEIASKLAQANDLATQGKLQTEIARTLGVSVMTLHRWRKAPPAPQRGFVAIHGRANQIGHPAGAAELLNCSSRIHGCGDW